MIRLRRLALVALPVVLFPGLLGAQERGARPVSVTSPEVSSEARVTFRLHAPEARAVRLSAGDIPGLGRGAAMEKGDEGVWELTLGPLGAGAYRYRFDVDGVAVVDPRNPSTSESNEHTWSLVVVPGSELFDTRDVPHGAVAELSYWSQSLERFRRAHVYTPPGYEAGSERYPVFYLLHGAFDCDDSWTTVGRAGFILDNLIADGKAVPMVVVMPAGHTGPFRFGGRNRPARDEFQDDFLSDLVPLVEKRYRVRSERAHRAVAGLSMGGAQTLNVFGARLGDFAYYGVYSSGVFGIGREGEGPSWEERHAKTLTDASLKGGLELLWFATGKDDFLLETSRATVAMLRKHQFDVTYLETEGGHTWINWRQYLADFAPLLFRPEKTKPASAAAEERAEDDTANAGEPAATTASAPPEGFDVLREGAPRGRVETVEYESKSIGIPRRLRVYLPPGYSDERKYPVFYLLHGIGDDEDHWQEKGKADAILDNLLADGKIVPMVVVMPNGRAAKGVTVRTPWNEQFPAFEAFEKDLLGDIIPLIESRYSVHADAAQRALAGLSMGGGQSLNIGLANLDEFAWVGGFSSAPNTKKARELITDAARVSEALDLLWISCGDRDGLLRVSEAFHSDLEALGVPHVWSVGPGSHTWDVWKRDLHAFAQRLFR